MRPATRATWGFTRPVITIALLGMALLLAGSEGLQAGLKIKQITLDRRMIFDPKDSLSTNFVESVANTLHVVTKRSVIQSELLYKIGDTLDLGAIGETERNLRALGYLGDIETIIDTLKNGEVNVTVRTHDKWSLALAPSFSKSEGNFRYSLSLKDDNFLGRGQSLAADYNYRSDRVRRDAMQLLYGERHLFGSHWTALAQVKTAEEADVQSLSVGLPYYSDASRWSTDLFVENGSLIRKVYDAGVRLRESLVHRNTVTASVSHSYGQSTLLRPTIIFQRIASSGDSLQTGDNITLLGVGFYLLHRTFAIARYLNNFGRIEDVPLGIGTTMTLSKNFPGSELTSPAYQAAVHVAGAGYLNEEWYIAAHAAAISYFAGTGHRETMFYQNARCFVTLPGHNLIAAYADGMVGSDWSEGRQFILGAASGLRGYDDYTFAGQRVIRYRLEDRWYNGPSLWIFQFGAAAFIDGGTAWELNQGLTEAQFHHSAGFGLLVGNAKREGDGLVRISMAYNFDKHQFGQINITSSFLFSAFEDLSLTLPAEMTGY